MKQQRKLGSTQANVLQALRNHKYWHPYCGWVWTGVAGTEKILETLVKRGYAKKVTRMLRVISNNKRPITVYVPTRKS